MNSHDNLVSPYQIRTKVAGWAMNGIALVGSVLLLRILLLHGLHGFASFFAAVLLAAWIFLASERWWTLLPVAYSFGGVFYFSFKIYSHEMALSLSLLALLPMLAVTKAKSQQRPKPPTSAYILLGYMGIHLLVSEYLCFTARGSGMGNVLRVYVKGLWPLIFLVAFLRYGSTKYLKHVLATMYGVCLFRVILGILGYYVPRLLYIPVINFILPGGHAGGFDFRSSALLLTPLALCYIALARGRTASLPHLAIIALAGWLILLGGGRASFGVFCATLIIWAFFQRKFTVLAAVVFSLLAVIVTLNSNPAIVYRFPFRAQRTVSIMILKTNTHDAGRMARSSDLWHYRLMKLGANNWLKSPSTFFMGNRIHPFDHAAFRGLSSSIRIRSLVAAKMGSYESGLWTILAVLGTIGGILYICVFYGLLRNILPSLWKGGISDYAHAFYFFAVSGIIIWIAFSWIVGHFPSHQMMMAAIAKAAYDDARVKNERKEATAIAG